MSSKNVYSTTTANIKLSEEYGERQETEEADGLNLDKCTIEYYEIAWTVVCIVARIVSIYMTISLVHEYWYTGHKLYCYLSINCILLSLFVNSLIHAHMCYTDKKFSQGPVKTAETICFILLSAVFLRDCKVLHYSIKFKQAEYQQDEELKKSHYECMIKESTDVALLRLYECFIEVAPQKILLIAIILNETHITYIRAIGLCIFFCSTAWNLTVYHRFIRLSQKDKRNIKTIGRILQICWHFCISVSRVLCIALLASLFPRATLVICLCHIVLFGVGAFILDKPSISGSRIVTLFFCLITGIIYLFTYISLKDGRTRTKYTIYYAICFCENCICVYIYYSISSYLMSAPVLVRALSGTALFGYVVGILFTIIYHSYFHPNIIARKKELKLLKKIALSELRWLESDE